MFFFCFLNIWFFVSATNNQSMYRNNFRFFNEKMKSLQKKVARKFNIAPNALIHC